jgi:predicted MFS family arabinose efflux permease
VVYGGLVAGVVLSGVFAAVELRRRHPLLDVRLFGDVHFATGAASVTVLFFALFGFFFVIVQHVQLVMGYSALATALAISPLGVPMLALSAVSHRIVARLGLRLVVLVGLLLIAAGYLWLRILETDSPYWHLALPMLVLSCGIGLSVAPTTTAIMSSAPDEKQGVASAVNDATREIGAALGIALAGSMLAAQYSKSLAPLLHDFPRDVQDAASRSLGESMGVAEQIGAQGSALLEFSRGAFIEGVHSSLTALAVLIAVTAVLIALWAPGRDGRQLRVVRRLRHRE